MAGAYAPDKGRAEVTLIVIKYSWESKPKVSAFFALTQRAEKIFLAVEMPVAGCREVLISQLVKKQ